MTNTTTPSGQRPPNATRPTDPEAAYRAVLAFTSYAGRNGQHTHRENAIALLAGLIADRRENYGDDFAELLAAAAALDAPPARLTPEQWQEAVERATRAAGNVAKPRTLALSDKILRAAFPHLAPDA